MTNDEKFTFIVKLIKKYKERTLANLVWRGSEVGIAENEVVECVETLLDLGIIIPTEKMIGDGWNSRETAIYYKWNVRLINH